MISLKKNILLATDGDSSDILILRNSFWRIDCNMVFIFAIIGLILMILIFSKYGNMD